MSIPEGRAMQALARILKEERVLVSPIGMPLVRLDHGHLAICRIIDLMVETIAAEVEGIVAENSDLRARVDRLEKRLAQ